MSTQDRLNQKKQTLDIYKAHHSQKATLWGLHEKNINWGCNSPDEKSVFLWNLDNGHVSGWTVFTSIGTEKYLENTRV